MPADSDIRWVNSFKAGNFSAAQVLWERYYPLLRSCARQRLGSAPRRAADEEDVALNAFDSFCRGVQEGRIRLEGREDLRSVLLTIVARKAARQIRDERRSKRGGGKVSVEADLQGTGDEDVFAQVVDCEMNPEFAVQMADECRRLLDKLGDDDLPPIVLLQVDGFTVEEIAGQLNCSPRTVARKLAEIRDLWCEERPK